MNKLVKATRGIVWKGWLLFAALLVCAYHTGNPNQPTPAMTALYKKANHLFHLSNPTDATDSLALAAYQQVITLGEKNAVGPDSLLFYSYLNTGILQEVQTNYPAAVRAYLQAHRIKQQLPQWSDSLLYEVAEHTGSVYYHLNNFDSASYFLLQAETLAERFPNIPEKERLYNDLGVLYYENGNYLQSRNYFTQALEIINKKTKKDATWVVNIENNIAAASYKLGQYQQAISIYKTICSQKVFTSQIFLNLGLAYKAMGDYPEALRWFHQVNTTTLPRVFNELAHTHLLLRHTDSANYFLKRFTQSTSPYKAAPNSMYAGMHHLYRGDWLINQQQYDAALQSLQQAIIVFSGHFNNTDIRANPTQFTGTFTSYRLFDALLKKATVFEALYKATHIETQLQAALDTYASAMALLRFIEKSYDTDEAKLFLKNNNQQVYQNAVSVCLQLHALYPNKGYAQEAFVMAERNKASVMYSGITQKGSRKLPGIDPALLQQERNIKYNLARLSIHSDQTPDSTTLVKLANEKADYEIKLAQVQHALEQNSAYYQLKYSDTYPRPDSLQQYLHRDQAVISFYATGNTLHVFVVTRSGFKQTRIDSFATLQQAITHWLTALQNPESGRRFKGEPWGQQLYQRLVQPIQALTEGTTDWTIIPDNILYYLPFESLPAAAGADARTLLETTEISYQFSSRFMVTQAAKMPPTNNSLQTLAFAPFAEAGERFPHPVYNFMQQLPASAQEIAYLPGLTFLNQQATKEQFLQNLSQYPVVHLATHAIADTGNSAASFIAFYPTTRQPTLDALYLEELYGLNMEKTQLIIISACETGHGQLVNSEGVLSLTRGFAYAGCASMVNSLWKADDAATAAILHQFHCYLQKGYTKSKALRQAKLDYLHSNALYKTPNFWAHLILTGDNQPLVKAVSWYWWLLVSSAAVAVLFVMIYLKRRKKST
ncbi:MULTISPECIES: CHAT domain-containing protein [Niastella]|uniref:CHAT domain-containing protein n=1 Tax=Niastella soli TaxID=2821487 RepID=A0ABS3Z5B5_9BACT|nr:CHAT domain-containing tetratricopeptide repeat protein [Niastella soli]MBO9204596.1 CHAT domain-containing protein [Niastella soli]